MNKESKRMKITCPHCGREFDLEEAYIGNAINLINEKEFEKRIDETIKNKENEWKLQWSQKEKDLSKNYQEKLDKEKDAHNALEIKYKELETTNKTLKDKYKSENEIAIKNLEVKNAKLENQIAIQKRMYDDQIEQLKEFKSKQSVKELGESLEQYCLNQFNNLKSVGAFPTAILEKDNKISKESGSKGDFIFRDYANNEEYVSIMFEMKNMQDTSKTKHKNSDFFKELDKDRNEKKCEYAILVSCLEPDNTMYNQGIVDVSYISGYKKMYVVRPDYFITVISLISNLARKNIMLKKELQNYQTTHIDVTNFEQKWKNTQIGFEKNVALVDSHFSSAIKEIDNTINHLTKTKDNLLKSMNQLKYANNKIQALTIRSLTHNNPTMKKLFEDARKK